MEPISETDACLLTGRGVSPATRRLLRAKLLFTFRRSAGGHWVRFYDPGDVERLAVDMAEQDIQNARCNLKS
jgi:hypothetical protein